MIVRAPDAQTEGLPFVIVAENKKKPALLVLTICSDSSIWWTNTKKAKTLTAPTITIKIISQRFIMDKKMWIALAKESYRTLAVDF